MRISHNNLVYRLAFLGEEVKPNQVGLCELTWRVVTTPIALIFSLAWKVWLYFWGLFMACKPIGTDVGRNQFGEYMTQTVWGTYSWWPKIHYGKGEYDTIVVRPLYVIVAIFIPWGLYQAWKALAIVLGIVLVIVLAAGMAEGGAKLYETAVKAAKQKGLCPMVEVK